MPVIYVTGNSGAGKSSVRDELLRRGYEAHDTDEDGITAWRSKATDDVVERPIDLERRTSAWYEQHEWRMSRNRVEELAARAGAEPVFLCGSPTNADEMLNLFGTVICLTIDEDTLRHRIADRTGNDFGRAPDELRSILGWHRPFQERYRRCGALMIDAARPLSDVVDDIVHAVSRSRP